MGVSSSSSCTKHDCHKLASHLLLSLVPHPRSDVPQPAAACRKGAGQERPTLGNAARTVEQLGNSISMLVMLILRERPQLRWRGCCRRTGRHQERIAHRTKRVPASPGARPHRKPLMQACQRSARPVQHRRAALATVAHLQEPATQSECCHSGVESRVSAKG